MKITQTLSEHKKTLLFLALAWTIFVMHLCLKTFDKNELSILPKGFDKIGHSCFHFGITFLWFLYFRFRIPNVSFHKAIKQAVLLSLTLGIVIEILQHTLTKTRTADIFDIVANSFGMILAYFFLKIVEKCVFM